MPANDYLAEVVQNDNLAPDIYRLSLQAPEIAQQAKPGQFVMVKVDDGNDPLLRRPFSIHQITSNGHIQLLIKGIGRGTRKLNKSKIGNKISTLGPLGVGFQPPKEGQHAYLVGGGIGIAPMMFLANFLVRKNILPTVLFGAQNEQELVTVDALKLMGIPVEIATDDGSTGLHGFVTELLEKHIKNKATGKIYACGPMPMLKAIQKQAELAHFDCEVSLETMMACGISACLGCAVSKASDAETYWHVCKDGPVFNTQDIAWEMI